MKIQPIIIIIAITFVLSIAFYFVEFHGNLSSNIQDWASFGSYISGVLVPILTAINIWVFVKLTQTIDKKNDGRRKEDLEYQKQLVLIQLRQKELDEFTTLMNKAMIFKLSAFSSEIQLPMIEAITYLDSFLNNKYHLFKIISEKPDLNEKIVNLRAQLIQMKNIFECFFTPTTGEIKPCELSKDSVAKINSFLRNKDEIISELQKYTIDNVTE